VDKAVQEVPAIKSGWTVQAPARLG